MQPLNYSTHAIESFKELGPAMARSGYRDTAAKLGVMIDMLRVAPKFLLPNMGDLLDLSETDDGYGDLIRLPYPEVVLEYAYEPETSLICSELDQKPAPKRIALAWDESSSLGARLTGDQLRDEPPGTIRVLPIFQGKSEPNEPWSFSPAAGLIQRQAEIYRAARDRPGMLPEEALIASALKQAAGAMRLPSRPITTVSRATPLFPDLVPEILRRSAGDIVRMNASLMSDLSDEIWSVIKFAITINCDNIGTREIPASDKLNKKRAGSGKEPMFSYRVLDIDAPKNGHAARGGTGDSGITMSTHLRRGHPRRLDSGRAVWVRPTVVNAARDLAPVPEYVMRRESSRP